MQQIFLIPLCTKFIQIWENSIFNNTKDLAKDIRNTVKLFSRLNSNKFHKKRQNIFMYFNMYNR